MGLVSRLFSAAGVASERDAGSDFWYRSSPGLPTVAGMTMSPETALTLSAVWQAVRIIAEGVASLPFHMYERVGETGRKRAPWHPIYDLLRWQPNAWQTAYEWWEMMAGHTCLRGNAYSRIVEGRRGFADQLIPLHPDRVRPSRLPNGTIVYDYSAPSGQTERFFADEMMHFRYISQDGLRGMSVIEYGANSFGAAAAADRFSGRFFANGAAPSGVATHPGELSEPAQERLRTQIEAHVSGGGQHGVLILEEGLAWQTIGFNPEQTQLILTREHGVREVARWFNVPLHRLADIKTPTHASIEAFGIEQVMYTFRPWCIRFEQAVRRDLILGTERFFGEFSLNALMRGDSKARAEFYSKAIQDGWMTRNEVRELENMNPEDGLDEFLVPLNMGRAADTREAARRGLASAGTRATLIVFESAQRIVRKEIAAATKAAQRFADDGTAWEQWIEGFYREHAPFVAASLKLPLAAAHQYTAAQARQLTERGVTAMADWEWIAASRLTEEALGVGVDDEIAA